MKCILGLTFTLVLTLTACDDPVHPHLGTQNAPTCSAAVHDQYTTTWQGQTLRTWHPQIDPSGCAFDHEHGSSPAGFAGGQQPRFDAFVGKRSAATGNVPLTSEVHNGFKVLVFDAAVPVTDGGVTTTRTVSTMLTQHTTGSHGTHRLCQMFHTSNAVFADAGTGEIYADLMMKGNFGKPIAQVAFGVLGPMRNSKCPHLANITGTNGSIATPMAHHDLEAANGYETWTQETGGLRIPIQGKLILRVDETAWQCSREQNANNEYTCLGDYRTTENGQIRDNIERWFNLANNFGINTSLPNKGSGNFCTDYVGYALSCTSPDAVQQFVKPGVRFALPNIRYWVPTVNIANTGPNAFKFVAGEPGEHNYNLGQVQGVGN